MKISSWFRALRGTHLHIEQLSAYLDGQVRPDERRRIEAHLAACEACRRELAGLRQTVALVRALPRVPVPRAFTLSQAQVGLERPVGRPRWVGVALAGAAAVTTVVLVFVAATVLLRRSDRQPAYELARMPAPAAATAAPAERPGEATRAREVAPAAAPAPQEAAAEKAPAATAARALTPAGPVATAPLSSAAPRPLAAVAPTQPPAATSARPTATAAPTRLEAPAMPSATAEKPAALAAASLPATPTSPAATPVPLAPAAARETGPAVPPAVGRGADEKAATAVAPADVSAAKDLAPDAALAFAAAGGLWTVDRQAGLRLVTQADGLAAPAVSDDRGWIAYRRPGRGGVEVWAVPWSAGEPRPITSEEALNEGLLPDYQPRRIEEVRWVPGRRVLAVTTSAAARTPGVAPRFELWLFAVDPVAGRLAASGDLIHRPAAAPDGAFFAFLRRAPDRPAEGQVWLVPTDGGPERAVLRFPLPANATRVALPVGWLPDGSAFRVALAAAGAPGLTLYQVEIKGGAREIGHVDGSEAFWSADAGRLAYVRPAGDAAGPADLFVADGTGAAPWHYATLMHGRFLAWSADAARFLYEDDGQLFVGAVGQPALRLAAGVEDARWLGSAAVLYVARQGAYRQLIYQALAGRPIVLYNVAADVSFDGIWPW